MVSSINKIWWWVTAILFVTSACGTPQPANQNDNSADLPLLTPRDGSTLLTAEPETASAAEVTPTVTAAAGTVEYEVNGIEVGFTAEGRPYRGSLDAPVVIEEFSDYQCPFCARFFSQTFPSIDQNQIVNGEVLLIFYDFPLNIHPQAPLAANAARCAGEQGALAYWEMHDLLFANISEWSHSQANAVFSEYGEALGLESASFNTCLEENRYEEAIREDYQLGLLRGVSSTPSFFINEQPLVGAQPLETFNQAIALVKSGENLAAEPAGGELPPEFAVPTPVAISVDSGQVAWSAGDPDAPVHIVEFTDYQCPFCQQYAMETFPTLFTEMIESGRIFYALKDLPLDNLHPEAIVAATAVRCAGEQEAYKEMHDAVFANQALWGGTGETAAIELFTELATDLGLDSAELVDCIALGEQRERVLANQQESFALGVSSTPTFYINGYPLRGAQPFAVFEAVIELGENGELEAVLEEQARRAYEQAQAQAAQPPTPSPSAGPVDISIENANAVGDPNAPITIIEYTDFQCPFCSRHFAQTYPLLKENYIDTGVVYYVFKDFPLTQIHPEAVMAANSARCAAEQDNYLSMHNALFTNQESWDRNPQAEALFNQYAADLGLDEGQFATCLANGTYDESIFADLNEGISFGVNGTPAFFLNGYFLSGAQPYSTFVEAIEFLLEEVGEE